MNKKEALKELKLIRDAMVNPTFTEDGFWLGQPAVVLYLEVAIDEPSDVPVTVDGNIVLAVREYEPEVVWPKKGVLCYVWENSKKPRLPYARHSLGDGTFANDNYPESPLKWKHFEVVETTDSAAISERLAEAIKLGKEAFDNVENTMLYVTMCIPKQAGGSIIQDKLKGAYQALSQFTIGKD